jgi:TRAP-type C4-dicarboxylate transport system permease small subunit
MKKIALISSKLKALEALKTEKRYKIEDIVSIFIIVFLIIIVTVQIVARFFFNSPPLWTEEMARYCLVFLTFIGGPITVRNRSNISLDFLFSKLPDQPKRALKVLSLMCELAFYVVGMILAVNMANFSRGRFLVSMPFPRSVVYAIIAIGICGMGLRCLQHIVNEVAFLFK